MIERAHLFGGLICFRRGTTIEKCRRFVNVIRPLNPSLRAAPRKANVCAMMNTRGEFICTENRWRRVPSRLALVLTYLCSVATGHEQDGSLEVTARSACADFEEGSQAGASWTLEVGYGIGVYVWPLPGETALIRVFILPFLEELCVQEATSECRFSKPLTTGGSGTIFFFYRTFDREKG